MAAANSPAEQCTGRPRVHPWANGILVLFAAFKVALSHRRERLPTSVNVATTSNGLADL
jgi:hypothetical protein